jgi:hypothetical protein
MIKKNKPDISLATKSGHFHLLRTVSGYQQIVECRGLTSRFMQIRITAIDTVQSASTDERQIGLGSLPSSRDFLIFPPSFVLIFAREQPSDATSITQAQAPFRFSLRYDVAGASPAPPCFDFTTEGENAFSTRGGSIKWGRVDCPRPKSKGAVKRGGTSSERIHIAAVLYEIFVLVRLKYRPRILLPSGVIRCLYLRSNSRQLKLDVLAALHLITAGLHT